MSIPLLTTKFHIPPVRQNMVQRPSLVDRLHAGLNRKITLISAPAGFGKTTLVSEWVERLQMSPARGDQTVRRVAWLSLDDGDSDYIRFLTYFIGALRSSQAEHDPASSIGKTTLELLRMPQPSPVEMILTPLLNEISALPDSIIFVLDDYHFIENEAIHTALTFLVEHMALGMHLVLATRQDPPLALARLRAQDEMTEVRAKDLRFSSSEVVEFMNQTMDLGLPAEDITTLEARTEGWAAGLQLAAMSLQGREDSRILIKSFAGSHRHVTEYLLQEVLSRQTEKVKMFLLQTAILDRLTGPLCDAVTGQDGGQEMLQVLEHANMFIVSLDSERRWYRYHHLFADLLRQQLHQGTALSARDEVSGVAASHIRASGWYENNGFVLEAFQHAVAGDDVELATRLMEGDWNPLPFRGVVVPVLNWLESLSTTVLDARPLLWVTYASVSLAAGQPIGVEPKLEAAEAALQGVEPSDKTRDLVGRIAATRATLALSQHQVETTIAQSRRALEYLHPDNLPFRTFNTWKLGYAYQLQGDRAAASRAYTEAISISRASGNTMTTIVATTGLGSLQEAANQLNFAAQTYRRALQLFGDQPLPVACEAHLGLACILYEWNDLDAAQQHGQQSVRLARQSEENDTVAGCEVFLARLKLAQGDAAGATTILAQAGRFVREHDYVHRMPEVAAAQVLVLIHQGYLAAAADLAEKHEIPISRARVHLAQGDASTALVLLEPLCRQAEEKGWEDESLKVLVLQALALSEAGDMTQALDRLGEALVLVEPEGFVRTFVDEGPPMARLLYEAAARGNAPEYAQRLLAAFPVTNNPHVPESDLLEPLSERELELLQLIGRGLSNQDVGSKLFISLHTVKAHTRNIYAKLGAHSRTEAVAKARAFGLLSDG